MSNLKARVKGEYLILRKMTSPYRFFAFFFDAIIFRLNLAQKHLDKAHPLLYG
jgi:hypothetical protein